MTSENDLETRRKRALCFKCVGEAYLQAEMKSQGRLRRCHYCEKRRFSYLIGDLAERIEGVFSEHYERTSAEPNDWERMAASDKESEYDWERDGEPVVWAIANAADMPEEAAEDIQLILEDTHADFDLAAIGLESEFDADAYYEDKPATDHGWQEEWEGFETSLRTEARFFSRPLSDYLASVFRDLDGLKASKDRPLVTKIGPGTAIETLYRARPFQADAPLIEALARPNLHLGPPPATLATAGRMNARGISVFYGATVPGVAIAEVRPPVGSQVAVARFTILRALRVLDLTALGEVSESGSIFDPSLSARLSRAKFLESLSARMTRPIMPNDEALDYLPTQAIADFLAGENRPRLDGILFPSVQAGEEGAVNVVLFHHAAKVAEPDLPEGTEVKARTGEVYEEGWTQEYSVIEATPPPSPEGKPVRRKFDLSKIPVSIGGSQVWDPREDSLSVDAKATKVHHVRAVKFDTLAFDVPRYRWEKQQWEMDGEIGADTLDSPF